MSFHARRSHSVHLRHALGAALVFAAACGGNVQVRTQAAPNMSFAGRSTFRILPQPRLSNGSPLASTDPMFESSITGRVLRDELRNALIARGYRPANGGAADFDVAYYANATQALDIQTYDYGYTWRGWPREYTTATPYERGTVVVDLIDPRSHELLWRGQGVAAVSDDPNKYASQAAKEIDAIVKKLPTAGSR